MSYPIPPYLYWHYAASRTHRQVALAAFLRTVADSGWSIYYPTPDPEAGLIGEVASQLGLTPRPWDGTRPLATRDPWAGVGSHLHHDGRCRQAATPPHAFLCLGPEAMGPNPEVLPPDHRFYVTGMALHQPSGPAIAF